MRCFRDNQLEPSSSSEDENQCVDDEEDDESAAEWEEEEEETEEERANFCESHERTPDGWAAGTNSSRLAEGASFDDLPR